MNKSVLSRYSPFLALAALQLALVLMSDAPAANQDLATSGTTPGNVAAGGYIDPNTGQTVTSEGTGTGTQTGTATGTGSGPAAAGGTTGGATTGGQQATTGGAAPVAGDKSKCAPGGLLQENITFQSPPCFPKFVGDNGGATYMGVTKDKIKVVVFYAQYQDGVQQVLAANNLAMTPEKAEEVHAVIEAFFNKHYEFYGRQVDMQYHISPAATEAELRAEAKAVVEKHQPFAVLYYAQGLGPTSLHDQLARMKVLNLGVNPLADDFFIRHSPYVWSQVIQGYRFADMAAEYYCKRMYNKNATLAGDPSMRVKKRKLGIVSSEAPDSLNVAERFKTQVTGGMCGSKNDGTTLYTYSADPAVAADQTPALVTRLKNDGITTVRGARFCAEADQQQYFPETFAAEVFDDDFVGRVYAAQCGPTQMANVFGIGLFPKGSPTQEKEWYKAMQDVQPGYEGPYLSEGPFQGMAFLARLIQYAGPNLNPATIREGARRTPQIGGWTNPKAWPGWKCCNPYTPEYNIAISPDSYSAKNDARQIYWDNAARSEGDGVQGAWVGVDDSRRYAPGTWTAGEPKQP